jgi:hypothetical protein
MNRLLIAGAIALTSVLESANAINAPTNFLSLSGDSSVILHWDQVSDPTLAGYNVYRAAASTGPFTLQGSVNSAGYCDLRVTDGQTNYYEVTAKSSTTGESAPSSILAAAATPFASTDQFLDYIQEANFDYFWYWANPLNGLVPDRSQTNSTCSIAAVGFGLTAIGIAIDHGWITRAQGVARVLTTLNTFLQGPQGPQTTGVIGYNGWFYHFLDMNTALRANSELSSIDTTLLLGGILYAKQYFNQTSPDETSIRTMATSIFNRVNWNWMAQGTDAVSMAWYPNTGFISNNWIGYNEGMIIYCLGMGSSTSPLPSTAWNRWTSGYVWGTNYGEACVQFPPLFTYQYSHCWIDFRHTADAYMNSHNSTYFENSRRASLAQVAYSIANPNHEVGYSSNVWGLTASDGPNGYASHGLPPLGFDDGTIAPTAAGGSIAFTPEYSEPALNYFYTHFRPHLWTAFGFRDAFNLGQQWYDGYVNGVDTGPVELGIDQGPIVIMIENYRTQRPWKLFMLNPEVQTGLQRAGFVPLPFVNLQFQANEAQNAFALTWPAQAGRTYQVEYSPDLQSWFSSPTGEITASGTNATWLDNGLPGTPANPFSDGGRFYRVFQFGSP